MSLIGPLRKDRERFIADLELLGFKPDGNETWQGTVGDVLWYDAEGKRLSTDEPISVFVPPGFPCAKPRATPRSAEHVIVFSLHREPDGPLCLWRDDDSGWQPGMSAQDLITRAREWFVRCREGSWRPEERPADLHLYYPNKRLQTVVVISDDWQPPQGESSGRFGVWQRNDLIAFAGDPQVRSAFPRKRHTDRILDRLDVKNKDIAHIGLWFRLSREPVRVTGAVALFKAIDEGSGSTPGTAIEQATGMLGKKVHHDKRLYVALAYPGPYGEEHWLFVTCDVSHLKGKKWRSLDVLNSIPIEACVTAPADKNSLMRRTGPIAEALTGKRVTIFGVGAIGAEIGVLLGKSGITALKLIDSDRLSPTNAVRHAVGIRLAGFPKIIATKEEILDHAPDCVVEVDGETWDPEALAKIIRESDIVIDATARTTFSLLLNQVALSIDKPVIYVAAHRRGGIGRIRLVRPRRDACVTCYEAAGGHVASGDYPVIPPTDEGAFVEEGCGTPTVEGAAIDLQLTANVAARRALDELRGRGTSANFILVVIEPVADARAPLMTPGVHSMAFRPLADCESCGGILEEPA